MSDNMNEPLDEEELNEDEPYEDDALPEGLDENLQPGQHRIGDHIVEDEEYEALLEEALQRNRKKKEKKLTVLINAIKIHYTCRTCKNTWTHVQPFTRDVSYGDHKGKREYHSMSEWCDKCERYLNKQLETKEDAILYLLNRVKYYSRIPVHKIPTTKKES